MSWGGGGVEGDVAWLGGVEGSRVAKSLGSIGRVGTPGPGLTGASEATPTGTVTTAARD